MAPATASPRQLLTEGLAQFNAGRYAEAEAAFRAVLAADARSPDAHHLLGLISLRAGRPLDAVEAIRAAIGFRPNEPSFQSNLALALKAAGRRGEAIEVLTEAVRRFPAFVQAHLNLGNALREDGQLGAAAQAYQSALVQAPGTPAILNNLGSICRELGDLGEAVRHYRRALEMAPDYVEVMSNLASAETARGNFDEAVTLLDSALARQPNNATAHMTLGSAYLHLGRYADAESAYREAVRLMPGLAEAHAGLGDALVRRSRVDAAVAAYEAATRAKPNFPAARSGLVFMRNYRASDDPLATVREARAFGETLPRPSVGRTFANDPNPDRRLRVGLVSGDLRGHAVGTFLAAVIPQIDQSQYALHAYATSGHRDAMTEQFAHWISHWCEAGPMTDAALADRIVADGIDILVDLSGHTMYNRLPVFAMKPAPVQMSWLGYSGTTGVAEIDYVLGDRHVTPDDERSQLVEAPWRMPDAYLCYAPPALAISVGPPPALRNGYLTFGSFNNISKLSDDTVALWARILHSVPDSRLLLKASSLDEPDIAADVAARFAANDIPASRLMLRGRVPSAEAHLSAYGEVDIALDPFPYNGTTTTAEALWMGVPVLGLRGDRFIAHVGESMLTAAGLGDWIASDTDDYVAKAATFGENLDALAALRAGLRDQLAASPLCDGPRFARNLEAAWRGMWQRWCASIRS